MSLAGDNGFQRHPSPVLVPEIKWQSVRKLGEDITKLLMLETNALVDMAVRKQGFVVAAPLPKRSYTQNDPPMPYTALRQLRLGNPTEEPCYIGEVTRVSFANFFAHQLFYHHAAGECADAPGILAQQLIHGNNIYTTGTPPDAEYELLRLYQCYYPGANALYQRCLKAIQQVMGAVGWHGNGLHHRIDNSVAGKGRLTLLLRGTAPDVFTRLKDAGIPLEYAVHHHAAAHFESEIPITFYDETGEVEYGDDVPEFARAVLAHYRTRKLRALID